MNMQLSNVTLTARDGRTSSLEQCFLRGSKIRFMVRRPNVATLSPIPRGLRRPLRLQVLPDMLKNAPMFKKVDPKHKGKGAMGMGASPMQVVLHHVFPLALPGTLTGVIIGLARALGETAPLLMIGMFAFVVDLPGGLLDSATALPVQIYLWAESSERGYVELTAAGIMVILGFMIVMNSVAMYFRKRFERRW